MSDNRFLEKIKEMTTEEKARLLCGFSLFRTLGNDAHGIPSMQLLDGGTGMNFEQLFGDWFADLAAADGFSREELDNVAHYFFDKEELSENERKLRRRIEAGLLERLGLDEVPAPGCYPPGILLGSTWNREVVRQVGDALGMEAAVYGVNCLLGTPNINLLREPRNGRFFEGFAEDPMLAGALGQEMVKGVQGRGVAANVKHFAANNLEINRIGIDQHISRRALEEMYLPGFEACVRAGVATIMTSYPSINGKKCTEDKWLLRDVLRERWGFDGVNMTDWWACTGKTGDCVEAGIDLVMPGPWPHEDIVLAVNEGRLSQEHLDAACLRMLEFAERYGVASASCTDSGETEGALDKTETASDKTETSSAFDDMYALGDKAAYEAASQGIVLLKNEGSCLPISEDAPLFLCGKSDIKIYGDGSAQVFTSRKKELSECIEGIKVCDGQAFFEDEKAAEDGMAYNVKQAFIEDEKATVLVMCTMGSGEGRDRPDLKLDASTEELLRHLISLKECGAKGKIVLILNVPGPVELADYIDGIDAVVAIFYPGGQGARALADILTGRVNPSGHLTHTWPVRYEDTPAYLCYPDGYSCNYGEGIYVGYRGYQKRALKPMFPFGWGLSYTDFKLSEVSVDKSECLMGDELTVEFTLTNVGDRDGSQVVQLYVSDPVSRIGKAPRELKGFNKISVRTGQSVRSSISLKVMDFAAYDSDLEKWVVEDGEYILSLGFDCENMIESRSVRVTDGTPEYRLGIHMTVMELQKYPKLREALLMAAWAAGDDRMQLILSERYTPSDTIIKIYEHAENYEGFVSACAGYRKQ